MITYNKINIWSFRQKIARYYLLLLSVPGMFFSYQALESGSIVTLPVYIVSVLISITVYFKNFPVEFISGTIAALITVLFSALHLFSNHFELIHLTGFAILPLLIFYLTNLKLGTVLSSLTFFVFVIFFALYPSLFDTETELLKIKIYFLLIYLIVSFISFSYENDWSSVQNKLNDLSDYDFLTNVLNVRGTEKKFFEYAEFASRYNEKLSMIKIDIDDFKSISKKNSIEKNNELIKIIAKLIGSGIRKTDIFGRTGMDEFIILMRYTDIQIAQKQAEKLRKLISKSSIMNLQLTASFGVTEYCIGETIDKIMTRADRAIYRAKLKKNSVAVIV